MSARQPPYSVAAQMTPTEARIYITVFRTHTVPGTAYVDTNRRRIQLDDMTDDDALFVAAEFQRMEREAAQRGQHWRKGRLQ